jgi:hypothetical protein
MVGILGACVLLLFLLIGLPIAFSLMLVGFLGTTYLASMNAALPMVARTVYESSSYYPYTIIPLFIVMGSYAEIAGISTDLYDTFDKWLRRLPGGLGMATIASIAGFSAISGSSVASSAAFGKVAYPEMRRFNYSPRLAAGTVAAGATIDFLIPPSLGFVIFGMLTEQSIGKLHLRHDPRTHSCRGLYGDLVCLGQIQPEFGSEQTGKGGLAGKGRCTERNMGNPSDLHPRDRRNIQWSLYANRGSGVGRHSFSNGIFKKRLTQKSPRLSS